MHAYKMRTFALEADQAILKTSAQYSVQHVITANGSVLSRFILDPFCRQPLLW